jgi:hypothetical protein
LNLSDAFALVTTPVNAVAGPKTWHWIVFLVVVCALTALVLPAIFKWQRYRRRQMVRLELVNLGNIRSRYALDASEPTGSLTFRFLLNGVLLPEQIVTNATASPPPTAPPTTTRRTGTAQPQSAQQSLSSTAQTGGLIVNLLSTLGRLLPPTLGQPILNISADMRKGQQMARRAKQASQYAGQLQSRGKRTTKANLPSSELSAVLGSAIIEIWAQTGFIEPNQKTFIDLSILPAKPYRHGYYTYTLKSRATEYKEAAAMTETYNLQITALNPFERYALFMMYAVGLIILLILFLSLW